MNRKLGLKYKPPIFRKDDPRIAAVEVTLCVLLQLTVVGYIPMERRMDGSLSDSWFLQLRARGNDG